MAAYATAADLATFTGVATTDQPTDDRQLQRATDMIDAKLSGGSWYSTDSLGIPSDPAVLAGLKNATCAQVEYWRATADELGLAEDFELISIGSVTLNRGGKSTQPKARGAILCPRAIQYLRLAGLWPIQPVVW